MYGHYVVGPTNVPQDSKEDRGCDVDNVAAMKDHIFSYFPRYLILPFLINSLSYSQIQKINSKFLAIRDVVFEK